LIITSSGKLAKVHFVKAANVLATLPYFVLVFTKFNAVAHSIALHTALPAIIPISHQTTSGQAPIRLYANLLESHSGIE